MRSTSLITAVSWLIWRELALAWRRRSDALGTVLLFIMIVSLFPLSIGPESGLLERTAPGALWVAALLATSLALNRLFAEDYADGTLEQLLLVPHATWVIVLSKALAQWLVCAVPLLLAAPLLALQFGLHRDVSVVAAMSLLLGTPSVIVIGSVGAALTLGLRGAATLTSLLVMPLYVPIVIVGAAAIDAAAAGDQVGTHLRLLVALLIVAIVCVPAATAAAIRVSLE